MVHFCLNIKKKPDNAGYNYVLKDVDNFTQEIESMSEKINLSLFEDFFESSSPVDYAKKVINTSPDENKEFVEEAKYRILDLKRRIKKMSEKEKKYKNADETLEIIEKILDCNKNGQKIFQLGSKVDKGKLEAKQKSDRSIPKWVQVLEDRFNFIKLKINEKKDLATMIDNKRYTLNDVNQLVNKIAKQKIGKNNAIKAYNNLVDKAQQISEL